MKALFTALGVLFVLLVVVATAGAQAQVGHDVSCFISLEPLGGGYASGIHGTGHVVITNDWHNAILKCAGDIPEHLVPKKAIKAHAGSCFITEPNPPYTGEFASDSQVVYTPGGKAHMTCHYNDPFFPHYP